MKNIKHTVFAAREPEATAREEDSLGTAGPFFSHVDAPDFGFVTSVVFLDTTAMPVPTAGFETRGFLGASALALLGRSTRVTARLVGSFDIESAEGGLLF